VFPLQTWEFCFRDDLLCSDGYLCRQSPFVALDSFGKQQLGNKKFKVGFRERYMEGGDIGGFFRDYSMYVVGYLCRQSPFVSLDCLGKQQLGDGRFKVGFRERYIEDAFAMQSLIFFTCCCINYLCREPPFVSLDCFGKQQLGDGRFAADNWHTFERVDARTKSARLFYATGRKKSGGISCKTKRKETGLPSARASLG